MVNHRAGASNGAGVWTCGLSLADFEVPSQPTPLAQLARAITTVNGTSAVTVPMNSGSRFFRLVKP